jgi:drug/metabolite transporter (DMT)-like permease
LTTAFDYARLEESPRAEAPATSLFERRPNIDGQIARLRFLDQVFRLPPARDAVTEMGDSRPCDRAAVRRWRIVREIASASGTKMNDKIGQAASHGAGYATGALFGLAAVCVWATWISITRLGVTTSLTVYDLTMLRFVTAGILLAPVVMRKGWALDRLGWPRLLVLVSGAGAPYVLVASSGLRFAPAAHAGALMPGVMPLFVALLAALLMKEKFSAQRKVGYALIALGVLAIVGTTALAVSGDQTKGHLLFLTAALMWACYAIVLRQSRLDPLHAAALVAAGSCLLYLPFYFVTQGAHALGAPLRDLAFQALFQGVVVSILALFFFGKGITLLGASAGAAFSALTPALAALLAIPILGEVPAPKDWFAIVAVSAGVFLASGGYFPRWRRA